MDSQRNSSQDLLAEATEEIFKNCDFNLDPSANDVVLEDLWQLESNANIANDHDYTKDSSSTSRSMSTSSSVASSSGSLPNSPPLNNQARPPMYSGTHNFGMGMEAYGNYLFEHNQPRPPMHSTANVFQYPPFGNVYNFNQFGYHQQGNKI